MKEVVTNISIGGSRIPHFSSLVVNQSMYHHHEFELTVDHDVTETLGFHTLDSSLKWVGESISIEADNFHFSGIVMSVDLVQSHTNHGNLVIRGYSPTILLETGEHLCSWNEKSLTDIVEEVAGRAGSLNATVKAEHNGSIDYMCQYGESNYDFLLRLAKQYNEWMYYNGSEFVFGKAKNGSTELVYGKDMDNMQLSVRMRPLGLNTLSYQSRQDLTVTSESKNPLSELNEYADYGKSASLKNFTFSPLQKTNTRVKDKSEIDEYTDKKMAVAAANLTWLTATSDNTALGIGVTAKVGAMLKGTAGFVTESYGEYTVYSVVHHFGPLGEYTNSFEALPSALNYLPEPSISYPTAENQLGTVIDNADPNGIGRVRVQLQWQDGSAMKTPWIRVMTPDAGSSGAVGTNRGFVFIPEIGDQVMVGFRYNDPQRPFVLGSMFHGRNGAGGHAENHLKSIITRSGHKIELDDAEDGNWGITIEDNNGNYFHFDTKARNITMTAPETMTFNAKNIHINAQENITVNAGENISQGAGMNIASSAGLDISMSAADSIQQFAANDMKVVAMNISNIASEEVEYHAKKIEKTAEEMKVESTKESMTINSGKTVELRSGKKSKLF